MSEEENREEIEALKKRIDAISTVGDLETSLAALPDAIRAKEKLLHAIDVQLNSTKGKMDRREKQMAALIYYEEDMDTGKRIYSNETTRKAELMDRTFSDKEFLILKDEYHKVHFEKLDVQIELNFLNNQFKAARSIVKFRSGGRN